MWKVLFRVLILGVFVAGYLHLQRHFIDYPVYETAALKILRGESGGIYDRLRTGPGGYYYSYLFALCFVPFALLGPLSGRILFYALLCLSYLKLLGFSLREAARIGAIPNRKNAREVVGVFLVLLTLYAINDAFMNANVALLLLVLGIFAFETRETRPALTGLSLGLAIVFKIYPAFLLGYFIWEKNVRAVVYTVIATLGLYLLPPILICGPELGMKVIADHFYVVTHFGEQWSYDSLVFQNLPGTALRYASLLHLSAKSVFPLTIGAGLVAVVAFYIPSFIAPAQDVSPNYRRLMLILTLALVPVLVPVSWYNMALFYAPLIAWLIARTLFERDRWATAGLLFYGVLFCSTTPDLVGRALNDRLEFFGIPFFGAVALFPPVIRALRMEWKRT